MKPETILDAYDIAVEDIDWLPAYIYSKNDWQYKKLKRRMRQRDAFRHRILKMFAEKDEEIIFLNKLLKAFENQINGYQSDEQKKDARIAELKKKIESLEEDLWFEANPDEAEW